ncbi:pentatricopeptide repeat-containing protein At3g13150-like [Solanum dulcamara]|uniref:pentatricopeptide repeat-containing protein At3g13150-like n=1 Tax=Solanum dulcamara TaxID=45834 RepID=UPI002486AD35|nr:pentatricopeptide repeat-containing protein At3g13150-like [Solanum dulcamara]
MASSLYRFLHEFFTKTAKTQFLTAIANAKSIVPTPIADANSIIPTPTADAKFIVPTSIADAKSIVPTPIDPAAIVPGNPPKSASIGPSFTNIESVVHKLIRAGHFSAIEDILQHQKVYPEMKNERFVVRLISLYGKAGMFDHAQKLFDEMPDLNCERTVMSFNALLAARVNSKKYDNISEFFRELTGKLAIVPDAISYNTMIKAFCEMGSLDSAVLMMVEMGKNGVDPDVITFNTVLDGVYKNNRFYEAEKIWILMENQKVIPNVRSYNTRLRGLVENNQVVEADKLFEEMMKRGVSPNTYSHNAMIKACAKDENLELAKIWYAKLRGNGCIPDRATFVFLIPLACNKDDPDFAYELCKKSIDLKQNIYTNMMQRVVNILVAHSMIKEANELMKLGKNCYDGRTQTRK